MDLLFSVEHQTLRRTDTENPVSGSRNYLYATFTFSADWSGLTKTAQFTKSGLTYDVLMHSDRALVPWEVLATPHPFIVNVFGGDLVTVTPVTIPLGKPGIMPGQVPQATTPSIYQQIIDTVSTERLAASLAADNANGKATLANNAATLANIAAGLANNAASLALESSGDADTAAGLADAATSAANIATGLANGAASDASDAASAANLAAGLANDAAADADTATGLADAATSAAAIATGAANTATGLANTATGLANAAAADADEAADRADAVNTTGWLDADETWLYVGTNSFRVAADVTAKYRKGDRVKYTQSSVVRYGYINTISAYTGGYTTITLIQGNSFQVLNATITDPYYSRMECPKDMPYWFSWAPSFTGFSAAPSLSAQFHISGNCCFIKGGATNGGTSNATTFKISLPVATVTTAGKRHRSFTWAANNGVEGLCLVDIYGNSDANNMVLGMISGAWVASGTKYSDCPVTFYEF